MQADKPSEKDSLITYPCTFPIKVMGPNVEGFAQAITEVVLMHDPNFDASTIIFTESRAGNYMGLGITVTAISREQLDNIYLALTSHPMVKVVL